ncbi:hypothetical protein P6P90_00855 [Ectobacillus antri]|uniref:Uncharacterized protein n=1 Tax=Ectobacillus antri TaxID=2486280 RepID=A0ABT6GZQ9_9BACI|nr:hypothetical protein [Ectobacillus antri]MDG4655874.1 hypothetical protein [Ectobacillus antri]MDG5752549.1 hypothetical protein [Ectobacillus antri]
MLKKKSNGKIVHEKITPYQMIVEMFPSVGWFAQAFIYSGILFVLTHDDKPLFVQSIKEIYGDE